MRKIDLTSYEVELQMGEPGKTRPAPYDVKKSISMSLYHPELKLSSRELLDNDRLARKIESADDSILLEESDYACVLRAFETIKGFDKHDVELVRRVIEAPEIKVKEET